ncbi:MAG TPA: hypothetical protein DF774_02105 [Rheinheimera sp.]|uniref:hypothetical protein n=1 Tax=Rheinheimera sp. TaxID=1869214 RepID=UPI000ED933E3|nr:hypothetical protein [Rheinheimera sp.]HCU64533.1 hypothetical protein [Rheinheimera sp.]
MHIVIMLFLVLLGFAAGENISWLLGLPLMFGGLYVGFGDWGGKKKAAWRQQQEGLFVLLGLVSMVLVIVGNIFNL